MPEINDLKFAFAKPTSLQRRLAISACGAALLAVSSHAAAQVTTAEPLQQAEPEVSSVEPELSSVEDVVVTGTRIQRDGYQQPTPVTVVSVEQLTNANPGLISDALSQLPAVRSSIGATNNQNTGVINFVNLRALGPNRTLVLLDGRRLTPATTGNAPDINTLPQALVSRIDVVTGGASAAYGSDAVAGVVNFILDTQLQGVRMAVQQGVSDAGDNETFKTSIAGGTAVLGGRGRIVASAEFYDSEGIIGPEARALGSELWNIIPNPAVTATNPASATNPNLLLVPGVRSANIAPGGLITSGPLTGTTFGAGGAPRPFTYGALRSANFAVGGDGSASGLYTPLAAPNKRYTVFAHGEFDVSDNLRLFAEGSFTSAKSPNLQFPSSYTVTIFPENAFLPAALGPVAAPFTLARTNFDYGLTEVFDEIESNNFVIGASGAFMVSDRRFTFNAHLQTGETSYSRHVPHMPINANVYNAADAVQVTAANVGTSGLAIGSVACRTSLTLPTNGCVPLNLFGEGAASQAALDYIFAEAFFDQKTRQTAAAFSVQGPVFTNWAGDVSVALGAEYRKVTTDVTSDALSQTLPATYVAATAPGLRGFPAGFNTSNPGVYLFGNFQPIAGEYDVKEGFVEIDVPLAKDFVFAQSIDLNAAVRYADYSIAGGATTWKVGLNWRPNDLFRFRGTRSRDIRAPSVGELFSASRVVPQVINDPVTGTTYSAPTFNRGNLALQPEEADTTTFGVVFSPTFLSGFNASIDYYAIELNEAISSPGAQDVLNNCRDGQSDSCALVTRGAGGVITAIDLPNVNLASIVQEGVDFEASYRTLLEDIHPSWGGALTLRALANYIDKLAYKATPTAVEIDRAGEVGPAISATASLGQPHWTGQVSAAWDLDRLSLYVQGRYVGGGTISNTYNTARYNAPGTPVTYINDNEVDDRIYMDVTARWRFDEASRYEGFVTVANVFDRTPPIAPLNTLLPQYTNASLYDVIGRQYTVGLRARF